MSDYPLEWTLSQDFLRRLKASEKQESEYVLTSALEHAVYLEKVGYIRGIRDAQAIFLELMKQYFPEYRT